MRTSIISAYSLLVRLLNATVLHVGVDKLYPTLTAAYNAANPGDTLYIFPGIYNEQLIIAKDNITFKGSTYPSLNPASNNVTISHAAYADDGSNDDSATLLITGINFKMYNINVENIAGTAGHAVALSSTGAKGGFYTCGFKSWQDTLYAHKGSQFFSRCYIEGAVDFVLGITGQSWFQGCTLGVTRANSWITAQGRTANDTDGFFVFDKAKIVLGSGAASGTKGSVFLGRPWGDYARVIFQNSDLGNIITPAGWDTFSDDQSTSNVLLGEYADVNAGGARVSWAKTLTSVQSVSSILADYTSWVDAAYLGLGTA